jgi:hypothetical protein
VQDVYNPENIAANTGFWLAQVFDSPVTPGATWGAYFDSVRVGWF